MEMGREKGMCLLTEFEITLHVSLLRIGFLGLIVCMWGVCEGSARKGQRYQIPGS